MGLRRTLTNGCAWVWCAAMVWTFGEQAYAQYGGGSGTAEEPYLINTAVQMNAIGAHPGDWGKHFKLAADIDLSRYTGTRFNIIGGDGDNAFTGVFDGSGHAISNFTYESTDVDYVGLFRFVSGTEGAVKDLGLISPKLEAGAGRNVGSLAGWVGGGIVSGCYVEGGSVSGHEATGGLVGSLTLSGRVLDCSFTGRVSGYRDIGGLLGSNDSGTIKNCYSTAVVFGVERVGGISGSNGVMTNAAIWGCYFDDGVIGKAQVGGVAGVNGNYGVISNSYSTGSIRGSVMAGGLVGVHVGTIDKCYSAGSVVGDSNIGGLVGYNYRAGVWSSFWDLQTSGQVNSDGGTGIWTSEMKDPNTFVSAGWDFVGEIDNGSYDVWRLCDKGTKYPELSWQFPSGDIACPDAVNGRDLSVLCNEWLYEKLSADVWPEGGDSFVNFFDWAMFTDARQIVGSYHDLADFASQWLERGNTLADIAPESGDGIVNIVDFAALADDWLAAL